jgi:hypothetical protein
MHMPSLLASVFAIVVLLAPAASGASAQAIRSEAPRPEIRGVVLESGAEVSVPDAEVTLQFYGATRLAQSKPESTLTTKTDASGSFIFRPDDLGQFEIRARRDGYSELLPYPGVTAASRQNVTLSAGTPSREVRLFLSRPAQLTGLVLSEETG